ncbi:MAG TPA: prolyl oligopeptidase family serine peptidase [Thermoanaerobaculia bacterium]|jgi:dipeptidyl aminopeptidase/acylaminoacyl peptidase
MLRRAQIVVLLFLAVALSAQPFELTVDNIMRGQGLAGWTPRAVRWSPDGQQVYFQWKQHSDPIEEEYDTYVVNRDGSGLRKLADEEEHHAPPANGRWTRDRQRALFTLRGDVWLYDGAAKKSRPLTRTNDTETNPRWLHDERRVSFVRANNLYVLSLEDGTLVQRTNIVGPDERGQHVTLFDEEKKLSASQQWVADEAKKMSDVVARRSAERKEEQGEAKAAFAVAPLKLEAKQSVTDLHLTADEKYVIAFLNTDPAHKRTIVPNYVTESGYTEDIPAREKVGDALAASRVASISTTDGKVTWMTHGLKGKPQTTSDTTKSVTTGRTEASAEKSEKAATTKGEAKQGETKEAADREVEIEELVWSEDGTKAILPIRAADNKDVYYMALDPATAAVRVLHTEHDDAWVRWRSSDPVGFLPDNETVWILSEKSGWMHLYVVPFKGGTLKPLTSGRWEVDEVEISADRRSFLLTTSEVSLHERHLYRMPLAGGTRENLTPGVGLHDAEASPDGQLVADVHGLANRPPELFVGQTRVTTSPAPDFARYAWIDPPIVHVPARDGAKVPGRIYKPANWNGGPAVIFVHGAGYLQNVHRGWSTYFREYMFHHLLMERGYLVLDLDFRASAGYGRDWRTAIYRHMGGVDLNDHLDAAKWLVAQHNVDAKRLGIYGGSYGGFIALMAMFTAPDVFAAGAALRPVTDWAHYNHPYTSNILNTPQSDPEAYRKSSPIYFAEGLKGALLICHGMIDVNVHYQDTVRLVQRLIELRKENWEAAMYPLEDHTFVEPTSWADEYKRILKLFETELK